MGDEEAHVLVAHLHGSWPVHRSHACFSGNKIYVFTKASKKI